MPSKPRSILKPGKPLLLIVIGLLLVGCDLSGLLSGKVGSAIRKEVRDRHVTQIDLARIIPFQWDELYLYPPYTPIDWICQDLDIPSEHCADTIDAESTDDGEMYMIFRLAGEIVHQEMHIRYNGDFLPIDYPLPILVSDAVFKVVPTKGRAANKKPWLRLIPLQLAAGSWGAEAIRFDLEAGEAREVMHWLSGFSYSSSAWLEAAGCLEEGKAIGSLDLIEVLNNAFSGKQISAEMAAGELTLHLLKTYPCMVHGEQSNERLTP